MSKKLRTILLGFLFLAIQNSSGQYWRTWTDPMYQLHWQLNENQYNKANKSLQKRIQKGDTNHAIFWHSRCRIAEHDTQLDSARYFARKAVLFIQKLQKSTVEYDEFRKIYFFDAYYLDLYYRKLLYQKYESERSLESPIANQKLLGFYLQESQILASELPLTNLNRRITLPEIIENINALNDTINYTRIIQSKSPEKAFDYLQSLGTNDNQINALPAHLKSFYRSIRDSLYQWSFEQTQQIHTELAYNQFIQRFPTSPQAEIALKRADELAFAACRKAHNTASYKQYLETYPYGKYRKQANMLVRYLTVVPVPFARADGKYVFVDSINMRPWIDSAFDFAYPFCLNHHKTWSSNAATLITGCALVMKRDQYDRLQWYYIEKDGTPFNDQQYDEIRQISENRAVIVKSNHYGLIDQHGRELLPPIFKKLYYDTLNKIGFVHNGEAWALFNIYGKRITKFEFNEVEGHDNKNDIDGYRFSHNRIWVKNQETSFFIDFSGNPRFLGNFSQLKPFDHDRCIATLSSGQQILIDTAGNPLSDTFNSIEYVPLTQTYLVQSKTSNKHHHKITFTGKNKYSLAPLHSEKPIKWAWYWGNPVFVLEQNKEQLFLNESDSILYKQKASELFVLAQTIITQSTKRNPKQKQSPLVKRWFNPYKQTFSEVTADEIGILNQERLSVKQGKITFLFHVNETAFPLFTLTNALPEAASVTGIFQLNNPSLFMATTDTSQAIIDTQGLVKIPFFNGQIDEFGKSEFALSNNSGIRIVNLFNQALVKDAYEEIQEEGFPGYYLVKSENHWVWLDKKNRLFGESI